MWKFIKEIMKTKTQNLLPKILLGTVHRQFKKCGKSNCKCACGKLHGAYYYHFVRVDGKLRKRYLRPDEVNETRVAVQHRQQNEKQHRARAQDAWQQLRKLRDEIREAGNSFMS
jgi:hypothetical protein